MADSSMWDRLTEQADAGSNSDGDTNNNQSDDNWDDNVPMNPS